MLQLMLLNSQMKTQSTLLVVLLRPREVIKWIALYLKEMASFEDKIDVLRKKKNLKPCISFGNAFHTRNNLCI